MNLLLWLRRFRHRCGYGIHSPWVYTLVSDVILQRMPYYAYDSLPDVEGWRRKDLQLLLRLANHFQPDEVEVKGYGKLSADWLKAGRREFALSYTEGMPPYHAETQRRSRMPHHARLSLRTVEGSTGRARLRQPRPPLSGPYLPRLAPAAATPQDMLYLNSHDS